MATACRDRRRRAPDRRSCHRPALAFASLMVMLYPRHGKSRSVSPVGKADDVRRDQRLPRSSHKLAKRTQKPEVAENTRRASARGAYAEPRKCRLQTSNGTSPGGRPSPIKPSSASGTEGDHLPGRAVRILGAYRVIRASWLPSAGSASGAHIGQFWFAASDARENGGCLITVWSPARWPLRLRLGCV